jgi:hypothetical protein
MMDYATESSRVYFFLFCRALLISAMCVYRIEGKELNKSAVNSYVLPLKKSHTKGEKFQWSIETLLGIHE